MILGMKSLQTSYGKKFLIGFGAAIMVCLSSCATETKHDQGTNGDEVSLKDDRRSVEELRKNIPEEKRKENDELKEILSMFGTVKEEPSRIQDRYQRATQRMREKFHRDTERERQNFDRNEKKQRDDFNRKMTDEKDKFTNSKPSSEDRKRFFDDQEQKRRDFNEDERTKRDDFNRDAREKADDFNSTMHDKDQEFNDEYRAYNTRYIQWKNEQREKREAPPVTPRTAPGQQGGGNSMFAPGTQDDGQ
jgi:hypothetical protein